MIMRRNEAGFSLVELMITLVVLAVVVAAVMVVMIGSQRSKANTEGIVESQQAARTAIEILARDIRSAGYGINKDAVPAQPAFAYVDSMEMILYANLQPVAYRTSVLPSPTNPPLAPAPAGSPLPYFILTGGSPYPAGYQLPAAKWSGGAEMVRYTLDINNDGAVNSSDQSNALAREAQRSLNPDDFVLARYVYGDSAGVTPMANNNGGTFEKVGLVRGPGAGVPPIFTVYLGSTPTPWDWSNGAIPASRLNEISRVVINLTAESRRPGDDGAYPRATLTTEVNSLRNVPEAGNTQYTVDGYVFNDYDRDDIKDAGEPGIADVVVRLGNSAIGRSNASGYYLMNAAPGMYWLKQEVPQGYGPVGPDSIGINFLTMPANVTHDFSDSARTGGWIYAYSYADADADEIWDTGEYAIDATQVTVNSEIQGTDGGGLASFFVGVGSWSVSADAPDSFVVKSANPLSVAIANGDTAKVYFALGIGGSATVSGTVYRDSDRNADFDAGEPGVANVWVAVTKNSGLDVLGSTNTAADGTYSIEVPNNMPDATDPYQITIQVPPGYFPTSSSTISSVWLDDGEVMSDQNFGVQSFQVISLTADRVLSLASGELMEKDWTGSDGQYDSKGHKDVDLILGSEWVSNPNVSVWFNDWNLDPLYASAPTYKVNALASVLSLAVGSLDTGTEPRRPDVVTGIEKYTSGNFAVWLTQNTSGNFGFLPAAGAYHTTLDLGDVYAVQLGLLDAGTSNDIIVGTESPAGNAGTIEIWLNNGSGLFTRNETYPTGGGVPVGGLGAVRGMALADFDADADSDLVVVTKVGTYNGYIHWLERIGNVGGARFVLRTTESLAGEATALAVTDVDGDGRPDVVAASQTGIDRGRLQFWHNHGFFSFGKDREVNAPGIPLSLAAGDFGGLASRDDIVLGYRDNESAFTGGIRIYFLDGGTLPSLGTDPTVAGGAYMTPALNVNNFNAGDNPLPVGARLLDIAAAQKPTASTGQVLIILR
jgi:prepilin-type N-terminal cleavage/methylation domain-containing protein